MSFQTPITIKEAVENIDNNKFLLPAIQREFVWNCVYNGIFNLQMLDANENMSKKDNNLKDWVGQEIQNRDKQQFLNNHLIPNIDLSINNFCNFIDEREKILLSKLKTILQ